MTSQRNTKKKYDNKNQKKAIMKEFLEIMGKDITSENFTKKEYLLYGFVAPMVLVLLCGLVGNF